MSETPGANLGFEDKLWTAADKLRGTMDAAEYKHVVLGRVYEYFLAKFAEKEGKGGGEFYTPQCVVQLLVEMLEPFKGRVFDPCCGSGGMFVQAVGFVKAHASGNGNGAAALRQISIYGQESNYTTWRLAIMNLAIRGIDADTRWGESIELDATIRKNLEVLGYGG